MIMWATFNLVPFASQDKQNYRNIKIFKIFTFYSLSLSLYIYIYIKENVRFTTPIQQLYNNLSHEGGFHILELTLM
jgi:hypothetical protein